MEYSRAVRILAVLLVGLILSTSSQKTFRRSCDCEYTVDGKCAYTLLLPSGRSSGCPSNTAGSSGQLQEVQTLKENITELLQKYNSQSSMINQIYSVVLDKILGCDLLKSCGSMSMTHPEGAPSMGASVPTPSVSKFHVTAPPDANVDPDIQVDQVNFPDMDEKETGSFSGPSVSMEASSCQEVCPDVVNQLKSVQVLVDRFQARTTGQDQQLRMLQTMFTQINQVMVGFNQTIGSLTNPALLMGQFQQTLSQMLNEQIMEPMRQMGTVLDRLGLMVSSGALCQKKGLLVSGADSYLPDSAITASSVLNSSHVTSQARVYAKQLGDLKGAWCPQEPNVPGTEWLQFDLGKATPIHGVVTRGRDDYAQWVEEFVVHYATTLDGDEDTQWTPIMDILDLETELFQGNKNQKSPKLNYFVNPIVARYVRIIPMMGYNNQNMCMRADLIGCVDEPIEF